MRFRNTVSQGGGDDDGNLAVLCAAHHLQGIHRGRLRCHALPGGLLAWELGVDPGGHNAARGPLEDVTWEEARGDGVLRSRPGLTSASC